MRINSGLEGGEWTVIRSEHETIQDLENYLDTLRAQEAVDVIECLWRKHRSWGEKDEQLEIPWMIIYDDETIEGACQKLLQLYRTPDGIHKLNDASLQESIQKAWNIIQTCTYYKNDNLALDRLIYGVLLKRTQKSGARLYIDEGRDLSQYFNELSRVLGEQFGNDAVWEAQKISGSAANELYALLDQEHAAHIQWDRDHPSSDGLNGIGDIFGSLATFTKPVGNRDPEGGSLLDEVGLVMDKAGTEGLARVAWDARHNHDPYREISYRYRGLTFDPNFIDFMNPEPEEDK